MLIGFVIYGAHGRRHSHLRVRAGRGEARHGD
jgi:hypothetical protein